MKTEWIIALFVVIYISRGVFGVWQRASTIRNQIQARAQPHVRPEELTEINITFVLTSLNKLNTVSQELSTTFLLYMTWYDPRLAWRRYFGDPEYLVFYVNEVWTPPLVVSNAIEDASYLLKDNIVPVQVSSNGTVIWAPRVAPITTCEINIAQFPVDEQTCHINITTWVHSTSELDLRESGTEKYPKPANLDQHNDKVWNLSDVQVHPQNYTGVSGIEFKILTYALYFKRHDRFHWVLLIIPFCCLASLMPLVFLVPAKYQVSRVTYSVSLMLAFQMYVNLLQRLLPPVFTEGKTNFLGEFSSDVTLFGTVIIFVLVIELLVRDKIRKYQEPITGTVYGNLNATDAILYGNIELNIAGKDVVITKWDVSVHTNNPGEIYPVEHSPQCAKPTTKTVNPEGAAADNRNDKPLAKLGTCPKAISPPVYVVVNGNRGLISFTLSGTDDMSGNFKGQISGNVFGNDIKNCTITGMFISKGRTCSLIRFVVSYCSIIGFSLGFLTFVIGMIRFMTGITWKQDQL